MLPMVGLFRLFPCPYYVVGLCERPHCSFRHCRSDVEAARREASGIDDVDVDDDLTEDGVNPVSIANKSDVTSKGYSSASGQPLTATPNHKLFQQPTLEKKTDHDTQHGKSNTSPKKLQNEQKGSSTSAAVSEKVFHTEERLKRENENDKTDIFGESRKRIKLDEDTSLDSQILDIDSDKSFIKSENSQFNKTNTTVSSSEKVKEGSGPCKSNDSVETKDSGKCKKSSKSSKSHSHSSSSRHSSSSSSSRRSSGSSKSKHEGSTSNSSISTKNKTGDKNTESLSSSKSYDKKKSHSSSSKIASSSATSSSSSKSKHSTSNSSSSSRSSSSKHRSKSNKSSSSSHSSKRQSKEKDNLHDSTNSCTSKSESEEHQRKRENTSRSQDDDDDDDPVNLDDYPSSPHLDLDLDLTEDVSKNFLYPSDEEPEDADRVALECFQMFQEYDGGKKIEQRQPNITSISKPDNKTETSANKSPTNSNNNHNNNNNNDSVIVLGKKRMAHHGADNREDIKAKAALLEAKMKSTKHWESPAQQLLRRAAVQKPIESVSLPPPPTPSSHLNSSGVNLKDNCDSKQTNNNVNKRRIAHVSNVCALVKPPFVNNTTTTTKSTISTSTSSATNNPHQNGATSRDPITLSQTAPKGERRMAHQKVVSNSSADRPIIATNISTKVPSIVRQKVLDQIYQECLKKYSSSAEASEAAKAEEKTIVSKCNSKPVYMSAATNVITRLRRECRDGNVSSGEQSLRGAGNIVSHHDILLGKSSNISFLNKKSSFDPVGPGLYSALRAYLMTNTDLIENGYPRRHPDSHKKGVAIIKPRDDASPVSDDPFRKTCDRCGVSYAINEMGFPVINELCTYHFGRRYARGTRTGNTAAHFSCCGGDVSSSGCCTAPCHVYAHKSCESFVAAVLDAGDVDLMGSNPWDIVAIDCEMLYTTKGIELARATFVGVDGKILYDSLVKPANPVLDYNTRFSGITEAMLENVKTTIADVQIMLLANLRPNTILIGHSLESDLVALKIIHGCVIDTSLVFPHKRGPPFKRALRNLCSEYLKKLIQDGDAGHDSAEDARSALDLILWKVKRDHGKGPGGGNS